MIYVYRITRVLTWSALSIALLCVCGAARQSQQHPVLWNVPATAVASVDLAGNIGTGAPTPQPPFRFVKEDSSGTQPKITVSDRNGVRWNVKFGNEVKPECFTWRLPAAVGYYEQANFYVASGQVQGLRTLQRTSPSVHADGHFTDARFQYRDPQVRFVEDRSWAWKSNPFAGSRELKGLEILIMLASNWDNKDATEGEASNTAIFDDRRSLPPRLIYAFTDWGSGMGYWGDKGGQSDWNCTNYAKQSHDFVKSIVNGDVVFAYEGHHNSDFKTHIHPQDVAWLMQYLGKVTDAQIRAGLRASGANSSEEDCFAKAIRMRLDELASVAKGK